MSFAQVPLQAMFVRLLFPSYGSVSPMETAPLEVLEQSEPPYKFEFKFKYALCQLVFQFCKQFPKEARPGLCSCRTAFISPREA